MRLGYQNIKYALVAGYFGMKEGILEVADKMNLRVHKAKTLLLIKDLEDDLKKNHVRLGKIAYQLVVNHQPVSGILDHSQIKILLDQCREIQSRISGQLKKYHGLDEFGLDDQLTVLKEVLKSKNIKIERITIPRRSPLGGHTIKEMNLPPGVLILCLHKNNRLIIPKGETRLDGQDHVYVMGLESEIEEIKRKLSPN